ncbi:MAG: hypothetical protein FJ037_00745 [Chloroflexi bacterium]|nr:hypothetical protein [Chloroflexota bacterium]
MRRHLLVSAVLIASLNSACGSDDSPAKSTATAAPAASSATAASGGTYAADARILLGDLAVAQRGLADAIAGGAPLSDAWKQAVTARVSAFGDIEARAQKLTPPPGQQAAQAQLLLAIRRSREAADTIATAVAEGNVSMLERANAILADAAFQTAAAVAAMPR